SSGCLYLYRKHLEALLSAGVEAYAVRRAKRGEAMWRLEITYRGVTIVLKMTYNERRKRLEKKSRTGKIEVFVREEGAPEDKRELDLKLLVDIKEGREDCKDCPEKRLAKAFAMASEKGFRWSVTSDRKYLYVYLPSDFRDVVRRFYSNA
ncbi:MAG: epoxyqueuosine reductase QueH, partial [Thermoproteus sp.]|nr:epoxyqueuosine reductase QueH [Thermoproteus sp.]